MHEYAHGTQPDNSSGRQRPAFVALPKTAADVSAVVFEAAARGLRVVAQATGHGAAGDLGDDTIVINTSALKHLATDPSARTAAAGAGLTWGEINAKAELRATRWTATRCGRFAAVVE